MTTAHDDTRLSIEHGPVATTDPWDALARYEGWVRETPDAPAVEDGGQSWTYAQLDALAHQTADALRPRIHPGDLVGVCLDRSADLIATAIALARLHAVYLPLGPNPAHQRLTTVTDTLNIPCLIGDPDVLPDTYRTGEHLALPHTTAAFPTTAQAGADAPEGAFYAVLTSGSTGTPKAVAVDGVALGARLRWYAERTGARPGDRHSMLIGVAFDPHLMELWASLTTGGVLSVPPEEVRWDPAALATWWRDAGVALAVMPTPLAEMVLERPWPALPALRHLTVGGDRLRHWPTPDVTAQVHNAYGPAEATVLATAHTLDPVEDTLGAHPPIGLPLDSTVVCVADGSDRIVPRGEPGELLVGGAGLALGYLDADLTARRFTAPPSGLSGTERVYRTGDRVRMRADGVLEFLGRMDDQVKVSGVRIEPAEVEAAFEHDPRVRRAVVVADTADSGVVQLLAFVQPAPGQAAPEVPQLLAAAREWLPEQAVPAVVRYVDTFPLDANGKVDRTALLATEERWAELVATPDEAVSPTEELVVRLCRTVLSRPEIGVADNFAESGGSSLAAGRLLAALEAACGVRLRAPEILRQPDLRALAALLDSRRVAMAPANATAGA